MQAPKPGPLVGRHVVVTGCTQGIGKETAAALAGMGATVIMACRNVELAQAVAQEIRSVLPGASVIMGPRLDLADQGSVLQFAADYKAAGWPLHVLVNNAGANHYGKTWTTPQGVPGLAQVNYLGAYTLTRLLEEELLRSAPSRVVNVSSVTHRYARFPSPSSFLSSWSSGAGIGLGNDYPITKFANVLFAFELQRRLGQHGVTSCAVDPGGVASNIWQEKFSRPPLSWFIQGLYAPPRDGAAAVVHAASVPWEADAAAARKVNVKWNAGSGGAAESATVLQSEQDDLRLYARGAFAWPTVTSTRGDPHFRSTLDRVRNSLWGASTLIHSAIDWPMRRITGGRWQTAAVPVPAAPRCYDRGLAAELWDLSADLTGLQGRQPAMLVKGVATANASQ